VRPPPSDLAALLAGGKPALARCLSALETTPDDPHLAESLRLMLDSGRRASMREACIALRPRLSWHAHVASLLDIYQRVAGTART